MNERIRELADEAAKYAAISALPTGKGGDELFLEKFATLIVNECLEACSRANETRSLVPPTRLQVVLDCMREIETTLGFRK